MRHNSTNELGLHLGGIHQFTTQHKTQLSFMRAVTPPPVRRLQLLLRDAIHSIRCPILVTDDLAADFSPFLFWPFDGQHQSSGHPSYGTVRYGCKSQLLLVFVQQLRFATASQA